MQPMELGLVLLLVHENSGNDAQGWGGKMTKNKKKRFKKVQKFKSETQIL